MKKYVTICVSAVFALLTMSISASAAVDKKTASVDSTQKASRTNTIVDKQRTHRETTLSGQKMASSTFPVRMTVKGSALCVTSEYNQLLPIYTRGGTFYMAMRLTKGLNWLNGLPRGRYLINNRLISIP